MFRETLLILAQLEDKYLYRLGGDDPMNVNRTRLTATPSSRNGLIMDGGAPPRLNADHLCRLGEIEALSANLIIDEKDRRLGILFKIVKDIYPFAAIHAAV
jgi:hypothetical protein